MIGVEVACIPFVNSAFVLTARSKFDMMIDTGRGLKLKSALLFDTRNEDTVIA
jgi:hypothetical protein